MTGDENEAKRKIVEDHRFMRRAWAGLLDFLENENDSSYWFTDENEPFYFTLNRSEARWKATILISRVVNEEPVYIGRATIELTCQKEIE